MSQLSLEWNNEAYVSLHLVQEMLRVADLPPRSNYSHWIPEFKIKVPRLTGNNLVVETEKEVDFLIEDHARYINFLIEVKRCRSDRLTADLEQMLQTS
jgi:chromosome partitioning protein